MDKIIKTSSGWIKQNKYSLFLFLAIFLFTFIFFTQAHPIYPYDLDDWKIMRKVRDLYPSIYEWNPTRVLPEVLMPRCGEFAMLVVYPIVGDITLAIGYVTSTLLTLLISVYMLFFYRMANRRFHLPEATSFVLTLLFYAFHFLIFRSLKAENQHLFFSYDLTDHYFYTIPNLLGSILVLLFITDRFENLSLKTRPILKGFLLLAIYLLLLSNLFNSIILVSYVGMLLLVNFYKAIKQKSKIKEFCQCYWLHLSIIAFWLIAILFEPYGGNANAITQTVSPLYDALKESARNMYHVMAFQTNKLAVWLIIITIATYIIHTIRSKQTKDRSLPLILLCAAGVSAIFLTLLGAKSFPYYLLRIMSVYAVPFFLILACFICAAMLIHRMPRIAVLLPLLLLLIYGNTVQRGNTFQDVQTFLIDNDQQGRYKISPDEILRQNRTNINTVVKADQAGLDSVTLYVPRFEQDGNWPISWIYGKSFAMFLHRYGITSKQMNISIASLSEEPQLPYEIKH